MPANIWQVIVALSIAITDLLQPKIANTGNYDKNQAHRRSFAKAVRVLIVVVIVFIILFCFVLAVIAFKL